MDTTNSFFVDQTELPIADIDGLAEQEKTNFRLIENGFTAGNSKSKFRSNMDAIYLSKKLYSQNMLPSSTEQKILAQYVGWGGIPQAFDKRNKKWEHEYAELKTALSKQEYKKARDSILDSYYTPPWIIKAIYTVLASFGLKSGKLLEPACGIGNFFGLVPSELSGFEMYGVEIDDISARIAKQLYPDNTIIARGFQDCAFSKNNFDCVIGNVPFGNYKVSDTEYNKYDFLIHDYFIAKSIDVLRTGGIAVLITSSGTFDKYNPTLREYVARRADLLGAVRLPDNTFKKTAGAHVVADILFFQKREDGTCSSAGQDTWVNSTVNKYGYPMNAYFAEHPKMILGKLKEEYNRCGKVDITVKPKKKMDLTSALAHALKTIKLHFPLPSREDTPHTAETSNEEERSPKPLTRLAPESVATYSFAVFDDKIFYRENTAFMTQQDLPKNTCARILGLIELRDIVKTLLDMQLSSNNDAEIIDQQHLLNSCYDTFTKKWGLINSRGNSNAFKRDSSYYLLCSLEILDEQDDFVRKADIFTKRTVSKPVPITHVDTPIEALAVSISECAHVNLPFMSKLCGKAEDEIIEDLRGIIFKNPQTKAWENTDEYLSGNVREKLSIARASAEEDPSYEINVTCLEKVQPKDLDASEIEVQLGATWVPLKYINQFMVHLFNTPQCYWSSKDDYVVSVRYCSQTGRYGIEGKANDKDNVLANKTYGTSRVNGYRLLENSLNLIQTIVQDKIDGRYVTNTQETIYAQQKQELLKQSFKEWAFEDPERREDLCRIYNEKFNNTRPRQYDGKNISFVGMNPQIELMKHQRDAVAHVLYGGNTLLAHCVGAGKTFEMAAAAMESIRLHLAKKCLFVVPNHITEQWGREFLRLYPEANILVASKNDFSKENRKRFCSRIATGNYDAVIIGQTQFERIPISLKRQKELVNKQLDDIMNVLDEARREQPERSFTVRELVRTAKNLADRLDKLSNQENKDDVVTFEQLGVDRLFIDESHYYKNLFIYTKMSRVAGIQNTNANRSTDLFLKCQYMDEITDGKGVVFATGTPITNSMTEMYTIMRYLRYDSLADAGFSYFDPWAATFGETITGVELRPEGTGYQSKTRFARFFNLPELVSQFREVADVQTADMLDLPSPLAHYKNEVIKASPTQRSMLDDFAIRAEAIRRGHVDPTEDNMLKITNEGRACALDERLLDCTLVDDNPQSKVNRCVDNIFDIWQKTKGRRLTQVVFCDISTPKKDEFNVYDDVRNKLVQRGIPVEEIAFVHEHDTTAAKKEGLFKKVRCGKIRILLGSTFKLGIGTNIQNKLVALHHLDVPWRPSDLEQREGRILRQGNENTDVWIFKYVTENTFDTYMWQLLENKQRFISQIMTNKIPIRSAEDVDESTLSYAEIKALATGNPLIKEKIELDIQVSRLKMTCSHYMTQIYKLQDDITRRLPNQIALVKERIGFLETDIQIVEKFTRSQQPVYVVGDKLYEKKLEAASALIKLCKDPNCLNQQIGSYSGFSLIAIFKQCDEKYYIRIKGAGAYDVELGSEHSTIMSIGNTLKSFDKRLAAAKAELSDLEKQLADAEVAVEKPFAQEEEYKEACARLDKINAELNIGKDVLAA